MAQPSIRRLVMATACTGALLLAGCVVAPVGPYYGYEGEVVQVAPPG